MPFINRSGISTRFLKDCAAELIYAMLEEGYHVMFGGVDDYYIAGKSWYGRRHFSHDGLISGMNPQNGTLTLVAYDSSWVYRPFQTPLEGFLTGMRTICEQGDCGSLYAIRAFKNENVRLDPERVKAQLREYLTGAIVTRDDGHEMIVGAAVYDYIGLYLDALRQNTIPYDRMDWRVFRMLWEHKVCMRDRIAAFEKYYGWDDGLSGAYQNVVQEADHMRFLYMKYSRSRQDSLIEPIKAHLSSVAQQEKALLHTLLGRLETAAQKQTSR